MIKQPNSGTFEWVAASKVNTLISQHCSGSKRLWDWFKWYSNEMRKYGIIVEMKLEENQLNFKHLLGMKKLQHFTERKKQWQSILIMK